MHDDHIKVEAAETSAPLLSSPSGSILSSGTYEGDGASREQLQLQIDGYTALSHWSDFPAVRQALSVRLEQNDTDCPDEWLTHQTLTIAIAFWARSQRGTEGGCTLKKTYLTVLRSVCNRFQRARYVVSALKAAQQHLLTNHFPQHSGKPEDDVEDLDGILSEVSKIHSPLGHKPSRATTNVLPVSAQVEDDGHAITDLCLRFPALATYVNEKPIVAAILYGTESMWTAEQMSVLETVVRSLSADIHSHRDQTEYLSTTYPPTLTVNKRLRSGHQYGSICEYIEPLNRFAQRLARTAKAKDQPVSISQNPVTESDYADSL